MIGSDSSSSAGGNGQPPSEPAAILIADDEVSVSGPLRKMLVQAGYRAECVETGHDAAKALASGRFGLLIADICMPGNHALDVLRSSELRSAQIPVIVITGHPTVETAVDALRLAVVDYFIKPFDPESFLESVRRAIERRRVLTTVRAIEQQMGSVNAMLQSVKNTFEVAGMPRLPEHTVGGVWEDDQSIHARMQSPEFAVLSKREREILTMIAGGESTSAVAEGLEISVSTVRNHLKSIYRKLGVSSQVALVRKLLIREWDADSMPPTTPPRPRS
jgi:DNA-binding NarL/FixJ family response regulator